MLPRTGGYIGVQRRFKIYRPVDLLIKRLQYRVPSLTQSIPCQRRDYPTGSL